MNQWYKNKGLWALILVIAIGGFFLFGGSDDSSDTANQNLNLGEGQIAVKGEIACLPYRSATPGQGCVKGIMGDDGKVYALNSIAVRNIENSMEEGTEVTAIGTFEPANTTVDDSSVFRYDGVLVVSSLQEK
jgi:hypothetical protein